MYEVLIAHLRECEKLDPSNNTYKEAADVVERKHGKWELEPEYGWYICSACRDEVTVKSGRTNFCPNCGADMRGEDDV